MESLLQSLAQHSGEILLALIAVNVIFFFAIVRLMRKTGAHQSRWRELLGENRGDDLERILHDHLRERMQLRGEMEAVTSRVQVLEDKVSTAKRHLGLVKFDAFEDVGGAQSFALAMYDDRGDGVIVNSLVGRTDCRVYAKPLVAGRSERNLSQEEQRAIDEAKGGAPRSILS